MDNMNNGMGQSNNPGYNQSYNQNYNQGSNQSNNPGYNQGSNQSLNQGYMYNNNYSQGYYNPHYAPKKQKSKFGVGMLLGALLGSLAVVLFVFFIIGSLSSAGMLKVGANGEIYVQAVNVNDKNGIGSAIEKKLNSLDSLLDQYFYFNDVDDNEATDAIFKAYLNAYGDKYTVYYTPDEYKTIMESTSGTFYGIGAVCQQNEDGTVLIVDPYEYAPAYKAGIRAGDCVTKIDGKDITGMSLDAAVALIKGDKGTQVTLEVLRDGTQMTFTVTRDEVVVRSVEYKMMEDGIAYIQITQFDVATTQQFKDAVADLKSQGMKGLVLDVRDNPGGVLNGVVEIVDEIIGKGLIVYTEDNQKNKNEYKGTTSNEINVPMTVLVNGNSASAAEIFAGALQDYDKAEIIGTQTFGKGIVQTIRPLSDGSAVKFTIAKYFTPKGQDIHGKGVTPDQVVELPADATSDVQLEAAVKYVKDKVQ